MRSTALLRTVISLVVALYLGVVLVIGILCETLTANFWINFVFMTVIGAGALVLTFFKKESSSTYLHFTAQYAKVIASYVISAAVLSLCLMFIRAVPWFVPLVLHIVAATVFAIYVASSSFGYAHIRAVSEKQREEVQYLILLETKLNEALASCESPETNAVYEKVIRMVQNSSYRSYPEARSIELELLNKADELMTTDDAEQANILKQICVLINKRKNTISMLRR